MRFFRPAASSPAPLYDILALDIKAELSFSCLRYRTAVEHDVRCVAALAHVIIPDRSRPRITQAVEITR